MKRHLPQALSLIEEMGLDAFCERYGVKANRSEGLVSLKYDQVKAPNLDWPWPTRECRGMIVREDDPTFLVAMPYTKFFNLGERQAAQVDWDNARILEKLDGSLMILYWHWDDWAVGSTAGSWRVATSGHPTAGGPYNGFGKTFREVFWDTWDELGYSLPPRPLHPMDDVWYFFELCRPDNRIVVKYDRPRIVLHGGRRRAGLMELSEEELWTHSARLGWECVEQWVPIGDRRDFTVAAAAQTDPMRLEGFIVVDHRFARVKVKNPAYVEIHHLRGNGVRSPRAVVECIKAGEVEEILSHFPEMREQFDPVIERIEQAARAIHDALMRHGAKDRKSFALEVKGLPFSNAAFRLYANDDRLLITRDVVKARILEMTTPAILRALDMEVEETPPVED